MGILKKSSWLAVSVMAVAAMLSTAAQAREPGVPPSVPPGNTMGAATGASPPPGVYFSSRTGYWDSELRDDNGNFGGQSNTLADTALQFMWVPGTKLWGGDYKAYVTLPLIYNDQSRTAPFPAPLQGDSSKTALGNIEIVPFNLSWQVQPGIFMSAGLSVYAPTGDFNPNAPISTGGDFWTFAPSVSYSYLRNGWNASIFATYFTNTENNTTNYKSGDELLVNVTALKDVGGFSIGPVGYFRKQLTGDKNNGSYYGGTIQPKSEQAGLGIGFSKRFGPVEANVNLTHDVHVRNTVGGNKLWLNVTMPIGGKR
ncbi:MAG: transporter [Thioclava marina]|uniref:SphA family protein n=1 Tax=Thioclava marina TaxID=1915077 RepID=UPI0019B6AD10|nr:transporter [Thioclava marina]MBC7143935.1 transporter [Thioclava marina]